MTDAATPVPRERGWRRLVLALLAALFVPAIPLLRPLVPVENVVVLLVPALAACTLVGWARGGRPWLAVAWTGLAGWLAFALVRTGSDFERLAGGWALLVSAIFGVLNVVLGPSAFLGRALAATGVALAVAFVSLALGDATVDRVVAVARGEMERRAAQSLAQWDANTSTAQWVALAEGNADLAAMEEQVRDLLAVLPARGVFVLPAMLALESLALLGIAWALYHRLSRVRLGPPLARLKDFRFNDQLVWGLVVGITIFVLPAFVELRVAGVNLIVFFGALYLLRGLGVLTWFLAPRRLAVALLFAVALLVPPVVGAAALWFGLGDTWFDWRSRPRPTT